MVWLVGSSFCFPLLPFSLCLSSLSPVTLVLLLSLPLFLLPLYVPLSIPLRAYLLLVDQLRGFGKPEVQLWVRRDSPRCKTLLRVSWALRCYCAVSFYSPSITVLLQHSSQVLL